jgi:hypothetical protein
MIWHEIDKNLRQSGKIVPVGLAKEEKNGKISDSL